MVRAVCESVMRDPEISRNDAIRRGRARGLEEIGKFYEKAGNEALNSAELSRRSATAKVGQGGSADSATNSDSTPTSPKNAGFLSNASVNIESILSTPQEARAIQPSPKEQK